MAARRPEGFRIPRGSKCAPLQGFENHPSDKTYMSGSGCTNADGTMLWLQHTSNGRLYPWYFETGLCEIVLPMTPDGAWGSCGGTWFISPPGQIQSFGQEVTPRFCNVEVPKRE